MSDTALVSGGPGELRYLRENLQYRKGQARLPVVDRATVGGGRGVLKEREKRFSKALTYHIAILELSSN